LLQAHLVGDHEPSHALVVGELPGFGRTWNLRLGQEVVGELRVLHVDAEQHGPARIERALAIGALRRVDRGKRRHETLRVGGKKSEPETECRVRVAHSAVIQTRTSMSVSYHSRDEKFRVVPEPESSKPSA